MARKELTERQKRFVEFYLINPNASEAARKAGYSPKTAFRAGQENMQKPAVIKALAAARAKREVDTNIRANEVLRQVHRMTFFDARKLVDADGNPKPIQDLDDDVAMAIQGLKVTRRIDDDGVATDVVEYKLTDRNSSADKLMRHLGLYEQDNKQRNVDIAEILNSARKRAAKR